jgi:predicted HTH domain antitoxin
MSSPVDAAGIVGILLGLGKALAELAGIPYESVMSELAKRTKIDTSDLDAAAAEQDKPLEG